ncbi:hypothetical protein Q5H91_02845 [Sphingomonas sp. KR1UV-12]|uniref:Uncharacterized protein n=1 Tax=Sphingomonas aurea TaxID=3063994 RepID=A0ABT9EH12_9SPHN|nr:hypothetical protein [Sphingomonas sp. KR1UV-12]MDP1026137.1 hypothetical protein [Sphingomonas sp. KR1UV-12]
MEKWSNGAIGARQGTAFDLLAALVASDGSGDHPHVRRMLALRPPARDLADAIHALCAVHGRHPGMIDEAHDHCAQPEACDWLAKAGFGFAAERGALIQLAAAVGPLPSTPGQAESETALAGVRHAVSMLAHSDRGGCATGAAAALVGDWAVIRGVLEASATSAGIDLAPGAWPSPRETAEAITALGASAAVERAMMFGARQLLAQHRGLWDLLEARAAARDRG